MIAVNVESISEVKVLTSSYQAEYGRSSGLQVSAVTKSGTNRYHGSSTTSNAIRTVREQPHQHPERRSEDDAEAAGLGLLDRRTGGEAGRQQQAVLLLCAGVPQPRTCAQRRDPTARTDRARTAGRLLADRGQQRQPVPYIRDPLRACTAPTSTAAAVTTGCFADGGVVGRIPASRLYQTGQGILNLYPSPNIGPGRGSTTTRSPAGTEPDVVAAGGPHRLSAVDGAAGHVQVPPGASPPSRSWGRCPGSTIPR